MPKGVYVRKSRPRRPHPRGWISGPASDTAYVLLTKGQRTLVDRDDLAEVLRRPWRAQLINGLWRVIASSDGVVYLSRILLNPPVGAFVDHINGDTLDNRRRNLRVATRAENAANRGSMKGASSPYVGVTWVARSGKWQVFRKRQYFGVYDDEIEAARASDRAAVTLYGQFARLNFPQLAE